MNKKVRTRVAAAIALPLCISGLFVPSFAVANENNDSLAVVQLESNGASVAGSAFGPAVDRVEGNPGEGETVELVDVGGQDAVVTVQYAPATTPGTENIGSLPEPDVTTVDGNVFWSGNFGDAVNRTAALEASPEFASAITANSASFDWEIPSGEEYSVLRDGELLGNSTDGSFLDSTLESGVSYDYVLEGEVDDEGNVATRAMTVSALTGDASSSNQIVQPLGYQPYTTAYDYKTFIPDARVNNFPAQLGCGLGTTEYFKGDGRSFIGPGAGAPYDTPSYRTQMFFNVNWDNAAPYDLAYVKSVGPTRKINSSGGVIATRTASDAGMVFQNPTRSGSLVTFGVSHEVGDPFCVPGGAIRYSLTWVKIYRSGSVSIQGSRQPVPAHEAYARFSSSNGSETWKTLYQASGPNFLCLLPAACTSENINKTVSG